MTITRTISTLAVDTTTIDAADVTTVDNQLLALINNLENGLDEFEAIRMVEIATPANPAATMHKMYFKSDGFIYALNSSGVEVAIYSTGIDIVQYQCFT